MNTIETVYFEPSYIQRLRAMIQGLQKPRGSREYKEACIELQRLSAPLSAVLLPMLMISLLVLFGTGAKDTGNIIDVTMMDEFEVLPPLDEPPEQVKEERPVEEKFTVDVPDATVATEVDNPAATPEPPTKMVAEMIKSPLIFKGFPGIIRDPSTIGCNTTGDPGRGGTNTEAAVMRTLRWLKRTQAADGSWSKNRIAMTGLAVLTFLAHCETPESAEFGATVQRGIEFLLAQQKPDGRFMGVDGNDYSHPIATYALCEAYGMTLNPNVKEAVERALVPIIRGQHPTGGWTYQMNPDTDKENGRYRDDTSYMGWCVQALKAAQMAQVKAAGLDKACKLAVRGFKANAAPGGGFGYTSPGTGGLTSVGTLCLQMLGASGEREVKLSNDLMAAWKPSFDDKAAGIGDSLQYYYYYATQSKFHFGGPRWEAWNKEMKNVYLAAQKIERNAVKDAKGNDCDVGWWENSDSHTDRPVMDTCLAALQLMVYYRYGGKGLHTTSAAVTVLEDELKPSTTEPGDIEILVTGI